MAPIYFDASALVKLLIDEEGSDVAASLWDASEVALTSRLSHPEVSAALAASRRNGALSRASHAGAFDRWTDIRGALHLVELTPAIAEHAGMLVSAHVLSGADAVHLASALAVDASDLVMAVWDRPLRAAALASHLRVAPGLPA